MGFAVTVILTTVLYVWNQQLMFVAGGEQRSTHLAVKKVKRVPDTSIIKSTSTSVSLIQCSFLCTETNSPSLYFLADVQKCHCNEGVDNRNDVATADTITYVHLEKENPPTTIRQTCTSSANCPTPSSGCYRFQCWCNRGYSFDPATGTCVTNCTNYGGTFQPDFGRSLDGHIATTLTADNETECQQLCIKLSPMVCRTAEYWSDHGYCYLSESTALSPNVTVNVLAGAVVYQRDCA